MRWITLTIAFAIVLWGCSETRPPLAEEDAGAVDTDSGGTDSPDIGSFDSGAVIEDLGVPEDVPTGAAIGEPCAVEDDCESFVCVDVTAGGDDDGFCSTRCTEDADCPRDFDCILLTGSGADAQEVCVPVDLCIDEDRDGYGVGPGCLGIDCDDDAPDVNPAGREVCDGVDNDCDGFIDDDPADDGQRCDTGFFGVCAEGRTECIAAVLQCVAEVSMSDEVCNGLDDDCDGETDEDEFGAPLSRECYDGDPDLIGIGECTIGAQTCRDGGYSGCIGQVLPNTEFCDGLDNDCNGEVDESVVEQDFWPDTDGDGYGDPDGATVRDCAPPEGYVNNSDDCNDADEFISPLEREIPGDGVDQDCDGEEFCFADLDNDGYREDAEATVSSSDVDCDDSREAYDDAPLGDCDDLDDSTYPGAPELCDGANNDCDERVDEAARCYDIGEACVDPIDCAAEVCELSVCVEPTTCLEDGTCSQRPTVSLGGGSGTSDSYGISLTVGTPVTSVQIESTNYGLTVGVGTTLLPQY